MTRGPAIILDEDLRIPVAVRSLEEFRRWSGEESFPERGRIDYLAGDLEVDLSPEELYSHGVVKAALAGELYALVVKGGHGNLFIDRTRVVSPAAGLSVEPDLVVVLWPSLEQGRVREVPAARGEGKFAELEGAPDLIVEIVSDRSVRKDRERLPELYARAGVPELWTVDARGEAKLLFEVRALGAGGYRTVLPDSGGWIASPVLQRDVRLHRERARLGRWSYTLEHRPRAGT